MHRFGGAGEGVGGGSLRKQSTGTPKMIVGNYVIWLWTRLNWLKVMS